MVTTDGRVVILDLGLVAELVADEENDQVVGTPAYMSPEQAAGRDLTPASDWYSVGELLYQVMPDLEIFNLTLQAAHGLAIAASEIWLPVLYATLYAICLLMAASFVFERRDFR